MMKLLSSVNAIGLVSVSLAVVSLVQSAPAQAQQYQQATQGVNGQNVTRADFNGGWLQQTGNGRWTEYRANGTAAFNFVETNRDQWSVYLNDSSRNVQLQIDIYRGWITYGNYNGPKSDLYRITSSSRSFANAPPNHPGGSVTNGRNVARADFIGGWFQQTGNGRWTEYRANGVAAFNFVETNRDQWSVYLNDSSRNVQVQIDLYRKWISSGTYNSRKSDLYRITSSSPAYANTPPSYPGGSITNGYNVQQVGYNEGSIKQTGNRRWTEYNFLGIAKYTFNEINRDQWSVYLDDPSRGVQLQLDLYRKKVGFGQYGSAKTDLYNITSSSSQRAR